LDFALSEGDRQLLDSLDRFFARHLPPEEVRRRDAAHIPPYDLLPAMGEMGLFAIPVPEAEGGLGLRWETVALVQERLGRSAYMAASIYNRVVGFGTMSLLTYGSAAQKRDLLPKLIAGRLLVSLALTEPQAGTDAAAIATRARRVEGG
jgi:alkylation response protein AidB-like acyl-CoA dehydrogenase